MNMQQKYAVFPDDGSSQGVKVMTHVFHRVIHRKEVQKGEKDRKEAKLSTLSTGYPQKDVHWLTSVDKLVIMANMENIPIERAVGYAHRIRPQKMVHVLKTSRTDVRDA